MIKTYHLSNGLRLVMENIPSVRSISIGIWIGTGSRHETDQNNGISHFIEHMMFKGTNRRSAKDIAEAFDSIGGHLNAFTSKEYTCYYAKVLDQHLPIAFDVLADMYFHSAFEDKELEKEKNVVLEELKMYEDTPDDMVHDMIASATYYNQPLGYTILGAEHVLQELRADQLRVYLQTYYTPQNTVIAVAGNIDESETIKLAEHYFGHFQSTEKTNTLTKPHVTYEHLIRKKETEQAHFCLGFEGMPVGSPSIYALILLNNVLGGSMSSRLFQEVREERGLAYSVYSYHTAFTDTGSLHLYAGTAPHQLEQVYDVCLELLLHLAEHGITDKELKKGKDQLKGNLMLSLESTNSRMSRIGKNELLLGRHVTLDEMITKIDALTLDEVNVLARKIFGQKHSFALISPMSEIPKNIHPDRLIAFC